MIHSFALIGCVASPPSPPCCRAVTGWARLRRWARHKARPPPPLLHCPPRAPLARLRFRLPRAPLRAARRSPTDSPALPRNPPEKPWPAWCGSPAASSRWAPTPTDAYPTSSPPTGSGGRLLDGRDGRHQRPVPQFVEATGYVTTAEKKPDWEEIKKQVPPGTPKPPEDKLVAGSLVFTPPDQPVPLDDVSQWWEWTPGADWRHPEGPGSSIDGKDDHPVVHVSWDDAAAYCQVGRQAAADRGRVGVRRPRRAGGQEVRLGRRGPSDDHPQCNIWQGHFPDNNTAKDGYARTSPVKAFPPNGYGLYDMAGNVWQWCADWYRPDAYRRDGDQAVAGQPAGPRRQLRPRRAVHPQASHPRRLVPLQRQLLLQLPDQPPAWDAARTRACRTSGSAA